jgi:hypothetical protein
MARKKTEDRSQKEEPLADARGSEAPEETGAPTYTISADTRFGMLAMLAMHRLVTEWKAPDELRREIEGKMREFELYEEKHR